MPHVPNFALGEFGENDVRFGSLAAATVQTVGVRFTPESGRERSARVRQGLRQMIISHPSIYFWDVGLVES
jgi:hypothetical protein